MKTTNGPLQTHTRTERACMAATEEARGGGKQLFNENQILDPL